MYWYMLGMILLLGGCTTLTTSSRKIYGQDSLFGGLGSVAFVIAFIYGFFAYPWWVPLLCVILSIVFWMLLNSFALDFKQPLYSTGRGLWGVGLGLLCILVSFWK